MSADPTLGRDVPDATIARLPEYLRALTLAAQDGQASVSSDELAVLTGVRSTQIRKDLSLLGAAGVRGVGYDIENLSTQIESMLGLAQDRPVVIVGMGNLGRALAAYTGFVARGFVVVALLDRDPALTGETVAGLAIRSTADLTTLVAGGVTTAIIATPARAAQEVADELVAAGVTAILNFAPTALTTPTGVVVRRVDLGTELLVLALHERRAGSDPLAADQRLGVAR